MPKYLVTEEWSGCSRGYTEYEVEALSKEEARELYGEVGKKVNRYTVRDDTESSGYVTVKLLVEEQ